VPAPLPPVATTPVPAAAAPAPAPAASAPTANTSRKPLPAGPPADVPGDGPALPPP
jgi:hypothetical protein